MITESPAPWVIMCSGSPWAAAAHRQQALARELAREFRVLFVDPPTNGRRPGCHIGRVAPGIWRAEVASPLPGTRHLEAVNRLTRWTAARDLQAWLAERPGPRLLWLDEDLAAPLVGQLGEAAVIYDATDLDWTFTRSWNRAHLRHALSRAVGAADLVLASSSALPGRLPPSRGPVRVIDNACDPAPFVRPVPPPAWLHALASPRIGYVGAIDRRAFDVELVAGLAAARPEWQLVLAGPVDPRVAQPLRRLPNVLLPGPVPFDQLPAVLGGFDVGLIPYRLGGLVDYVHPKKTFEYLAAGLPVVTTPLPALVALSAPLRLAHDAREFVAAIELALAEADDPFAQVRRRRYAARQCWATRGQEVRALLSALLPAPAVVPQGVAA